MTLALDPDAKAWRTLDPPPQPDLIGGLWTGQQLLYWESEETSEGGDWLLDPTEGTWTTVPPDPFGETFDRSYGWTGSELILAALPIDKDEGQEGGRPFQTATLDLATGSWSAPEASPVTFRAIEWFVFDGAFVNPSQDVTSPDGRHISGAKNLQTGNGEMCRKYRHPRS